MEAILHITDFGVESETAFLSTCQFARAKSAEIIVLHVLPSEICSMEDRDGDELDRDSPLYQLCWERFSRLSEMADGIPTSLQVKIGPPVATIANVAKGELCKVISLVAPLYGQEHRQSRDGIANDCDNQFTYSYPDSFETA